MQGVIVSVSDMGDLFYLDKSYRISQYSSEENIDALISLIKSDLRKIRSSPNIRISTVKDLYSREGVNLLTEYTLL